MERAEGLDIVQQVLRGLLVSIVATRREDAALIASSLQAFASNPQLESEARVMLSDLALGLDMIASANSKRS